MEKVPLKKKNQENKFVCLDVIALLSNTKCFFPGDLASLSKQVAEECKIKGKCL